jgi:CubicO group peptidase (beta-lactamase class C family)
MADPSIEAVNEYISRGMVYVACREAQIIGIYVLIKTRPFTLELVNVAVAKKYQGKGIGKRLVLDAIEKAKQAKAKILEYDFLSNYTLTRDIGEKYEYSNLGVGLLGHILALKAGMDYETLVRTRICTPLKMKSTVITISPRLRSRLAKGYDLKGVPISNWDLPTLAGAGALRSSLYDMLIYAEANLGLIKTNLAPAIEKTHYIKADAGSPNLDIAMAWHISNMDSKEIIAHNGQTGGYYAYIGLNKKLKRGVVILTNSITRSSEIGKQIYNFLTGN